MADNDIPCAQSKVTEEYGIIGLPDGDSDSLLPEKPKKSCYMIVTPDPRDSTGATNSQGQTVQKWFIKFGEGNPTYWPDHNSNLDEDPTLGKEKFGRSGTPKGTYKTANPSYFVGINKTTSIVGELEQQIFVDRKFSRAGQSLEWYVVYENGVPPMGPSLEGFVTRFPTLDLTNPVVVNAFIADVIALIPDRCAQP